MNKEFEPSEAFVSHLEWQLLSEVRRENRFNRAASRSMEPPRKLRLWVIGLVCFAMGIVGTTATQYFRNSPRAEYLIAKAESDVEIAQARVDATREILEWLRSKAAQEHPLYTDDSQRQREIEIAEERLEDSRSDLKLRRLELKETRVTHQRPATELWEPLVNGEDLLSQRLQVELERKQRLFNRFVNGMGGVFPDDPERIRADYFTGETKRKIEGLEHSIQLRKQFLSGEVTQAELLNLERLDEAKDTVERMTGAIKVFEQHYQEAKAQFEAGQASPLAVSDAEIELKRMRAFLRLSEKEVELLEQGLQIDQE
jgi:hypothetical protein